MPVRTKCSAPDYVLKDVQVTQEGIVLEIEDPHVAISTSHCQSRAIGRNGGAGNFTGLLRQAGPPTTGRHVENIDAAIICFAEPFAVRGEAEPPAPAAAAGPGKL